MSRAGAGRRVALDLAPPLLWMAAIFAVSSIPGDAIARVKVDALETLLRDGVLHASEFAVLAVLVRRAMVAYGVVRDRALWIATLMLAVAYAGTDESHQVLVAGRHASLLDVGYDALGAVLGVLAAEIAPRVRRALARS